MISTLREISGRHAKRPLHARMDARGCVSIPEGMGSVNLSCEEDGDILIITAKASNKERKRFHYVGIEYMRPYVDAWQVRSIVFTFEPTGPDTWTGIVNRRGQQD